MRLGGLHGLTVDSVWAPPPPYKTVAQPSPTSSRKLSLSWSDDTTFEEWVAPCLTPVVRRPPFAAWQNATTQPSVGDTRLASALASPNIQRAVEELITAVRPSRLALDHRDKVVTLVQIVLSATLGIKIVPHGSYALRTFLPDSDVNLSSFFTRNHDKSWFQRVIRALAADNAESVDPLIRVPASQRYANQAPPTIGLRSAVFTTAPDGTRSIHVEVNGVAVEIGCNQGRSVAMTAFLEDCSRRLGRAHLLKRTLLLVKMFLVNEAGIGHLLPSAAIATVVLRAFAGADNIRTPLQGLICALDALLADDWRYSVFTIFGWLPLRDPFNL